MLQDGAAGTINQTHSGSGDNVHNKYLVQIQALAPANLSKAIALVIGSIRDQKPDEAKTRLEMLRVTVDTSSDAAALLDVIAIYGDLVKPDQAQDAFNAAMRIAASTTDETVRDLCIAALLKFSRRIGYDEAAKAEYLRQAQPGPYSREAFYRYFAPYDILLSVSKQLILTEGDLTGVIDGAFRIEAIDIAAPVAAKLNKLFPSYNSQVLQLLAKAFTLNPAVKKQQYWLSDPQVKKDVDELVEEVSELIEISEGTDARLYDMAGPILHYFQVIWPTRLVDACGKYPVPLAVNWPDIAARVKSITGDSSALPERAQALRLAQRGNEARSAWCQARLEGVVDLQDALFFVQLAKPVELRRWLTLEKTISDACDIDSAVVTLLVWAKIVVESDDLFERYQLGLKVDEFVTQFEARFSELTVHIVVELAGALFNAQLPNKALAITSVVLPHGDLWASSFVLLHLRCLLETEQFQSFDLVVARIDDAEHVAVLHYLSMKEEALGNPERALAFSDEMIRKAPDQLSVWLRGCRLRERFKDLNEQRRFHDAVPDQLLEEFSHNTMVAMRYFTSAGNFKRAEPRLVRWFMEDPSARAIPLVDFHLGFAFRRQAILLDSRSLPGHLGGVSFEQDGVKQLRMIVEEGTATGPHVLNNDTQLAKLLTSLEVGQSEELGMVTYRLLEWLPPYIACLRLASTLRHVQNDGSDVFALFTLPKDPAQLGAFLQQKFGSDRVKESLGLAAGMPLYLQGHALDRNDPIKAALQVWSDSSITKAWLVNEGIEQPAEIVLDAYAIAYFVSTNVVDPLLATGITFILPEETREMLQRWVENVTHQDFMSMGFSENGQLIRHTAADVQARAGHILHGLQRILDEAVVRHPNVHDTALELYAIRDVIDHTVYLAMQLSSANNLPWFCMDGDFARFHQANGFKVVNVYRAMLKVADTPNFVFEDKRHALLLFAQGALPLPLMKVDLDGLAHHSNPLSSFILYKIFQNYGDAIFVTTQQQDILLQAVIKHVVSTYYRNDEVTLSPDYTPWARYEVYVFNHGLRLFILGRSEETAEYWVAKALKMAIWVVQNDKNLTLHVINLFSDFVIGHFLNEEAVVEYFQKK